MTTLILTVASTNNLESSFSPFSCNLNPIGMIHLQNAECDIFFPPPVYHVVQDDCIFPWWLQLTAILLMSYSQHRNRRDILQIEILFLHFIPQTPLLSSPCPLILLIPLSLLYFSPYHLSPFNIYTWHIFLTHFVYVCLSPVECKPHKCRDSVC